MTTEITTRLAECEGVIERGLATFVEVGKALDAEAMYAVAAKERQLGRSSRSFNGRERPDGAAMQDR